MALEPEKLQEWIGRKEAAVDHITPSAIAGEPSADGKKAKLWALNPDGALALTAEVEFR